MNFTFLPARQNPLSIENVTRMEFRFAKSDWDFEIAKLESLRFRAAVVGHQGSGKSTLLRGLNTRLQNMGLATHYLFIPSVETWQSESARFCVKTAIHDAIAASVNGKKVLLDGFERIGFRLRLSLLRKTRRSSLVITTHTPCKLPTWIQCRTDQQLMKDLLIELGFEQKEILLAGKHAFEEHGGNVRMALRDLYDQFANGRYNKFLQL